MKRLIALELFSLAVIPVALATTDFAPQIPDARPVSFVSPTTAVVNWRTQKRCETKLQLRRGSFIAGTPGFEDVWKDATIIEGPKDRTTDHSMT